MKVNQDKTISIVILTFTAIMITWWIYSLYGPSTGGIELSEISLKNLLIWADHNTDLIIIFYIFLCLQLAGLSEFKQGQDYLIVAFISLIFTPIGLLFIKNEKNDKIK